MERNVAIVRCEDYDRTKLKAALVSGIAAIGGLNWVKSGMRIAIKANLMSAKKPDEAVTTNPELIYVMCDLLLERGAEVVVGDSPGGPYTEAFLRRIYSATGVDVVRDTGAKLNDDFSVVDAQIANGVVMKEFKATGYLSKVDAIIDMCKIKTHGLMAFTGACKNFYGGVAGMYKSEYHYIYPTHEQFSNMLVDLCEYWKPVLCIGDAIVAMEGNGPSGGTPRKLGALLVSKNAHALDLAAAHMIKLKSTDVPTLTAAVTRGLIPLTYDELSYPLCKPDEFVCPDFILVDKKPVTLWGSRNPRIAAILRAAFASSPHIDSARCVGCGECVKVCHAKAVSITERKAYIDEKKCIRCFCCQEFCPIAAVSVKRPLLARLINRK